MDKINKINFSKILDPIILMIETFGEDIFATTQFGV
jgi:hypothetical protein